MNCPKCESERLGSELIGENTWKYRCFDCEFEWRDKVETDGDSVYKRKCVNCGVRFEWWYDVNPKEVNWSLCKPCYYKKLGMKCYECGKKIDEPTIIVGGKHPLCLSCSVDKGYINEKGGIK